MQQIADVAESSWLDCWPEMMHKEAEGQLDIAETCKDDSNG